MLTATIEEVLFQAPDGGFVVVRARPDGESQPLVATGAMGETHPGDVFRFSGGFDEHPRYGRQFKVATAVPVTPSTVEGILRFLGSGRFEGIGKKIVAALQPSCLTAPIADENNPDCVVEDVTITAGEPVRKSIPQCSKSGGAKPCWNTKQIAMCQKICNPKTGTFQQFGIDIDRGGMMAPPNTTAEVSCATIAIANEDPNAACGGAP